VVQAVSVCVFVFFFSSRRRHTRSKRDWSSDVCSSDLSSPSVAGYITTLDGLELVPPKVVSVEELPGLDYALLLDMRNKTEFADRSEERRVGKEWRPRGGPEQ